MCPHNNQTATSQKFSAIEVCYNSSYNHNRNCNSYYNNMMDDDDDDDDDDYYYYSGVRQKKSKV